MWNPWFIHLNCDSSRVLTVILRKSWTLNSPNGTYSTRPFLTRLSSGDLDSTQTPLIWSGQEKFFAETVLPVKQMRRHHRQVDPGQRSLKTHRESGRVVRTQKSLTISKIPLPTLMTPNLLSATMTLPERCFIRQLSLVFRVVAGGDSVPWRKIDSFAR